MVNNPASSFQPIKTAKNTVKDEENPETSEEVPVQNNNNASCFTLE